MSGNIGAGQIITLPSGSSLQSVYANQLRVSVTVSDITIIFGALEDRGANQLINEDKASVHLSPITAKLLLQNLSMIIHAYEQVIGNIPVPPKIIAIAESQTENLIKNLTDQMSP
jgi:hypothetical protein